jgi:hypothetical protein
MFGTNPMLFWLASRAALARGSAVSMVNIFSVRVAVLAVIQSFSGDEVSVELDSDVETEAPMI